jgi:hypothetical protein
MIMSVGVGVLLGVTFGGSVGLGPVVGVTVGESTPVGVTDGVRVLIGVGLEMSVGCGEDEHEADFSSLVVPQSLLATTVQV